MARLPDLSDADWLAIEREYCARSLSNFIRRAWPVLEPGQPYAHGWHMDAIAEHLEAVTSGQIRRLLINVPPGTMKSMSVGIFWPAWEWGPKGMPHIRFIGASHEEGLATRDNMRMRRLIASDWYQRLWPLAMVSDQNAKTYFENEATGWRQSCPVRSMTGRRGDRVAWDDPHSVEDAHSVASLDETKRVFNETLPTRLNNPDSSAIVIVMQRLSVKDVSALAIERGYEHLCLPMEWEGPRKATSIGFVDPRGTVGELLFPERFPAEVVAQLKKEMASEYAIAGQLQQRPAPATGGEFKPDLIVTVDAIPAGVQQWCRGWDLGATEGAGSFTAGVKVGRLPDGRYIVADVKREQYATHKRDALIKATADADGRGAVKQSLPQDPGQAGKGQAAAFASMLAGHIVHTSPETGDKTVRARPFASQVNAGNVLMLKAPWNDRFTEELRLFPNEPNDQVDAASRAFNELLQPAAGFL